MNKNNNRDIPKKPISKTNIYNKYGFIRTQTEQYYCPSCDTVLNAGPNYQPKYCSECGQRVTFEQILWKPDIELGFIPEEDRLTREEVAKQIRQQIKKENYYELTTNGHSENRKRRTCV